MYRSRTRNCDVDQACEVKLKTILKLKVNGFEVERAIEPATTLLEFLREEVALTGTKRGCDVGDCGCCTVLLEGKPILSCLLLAVEAAGKSVTTIEGVETNGQLHPVQEAMVNEGAIQCGFCTPAMVINGVHLLENNPKPSPEEVKTCVSGTICRCTGYTKIEKSILKAAEAMSEK